MSLKTGWSKTMLGGPSCIPNRLSQVVAAGYGVGMLRTQHPLPSAQGLLVEPDLLLIAPQSAVANGHVAGKYNNFRMFESKCFSRFIQNTPVMLYARPQCGRIMGSGLIPHGHVANFGGVVVWSRCLLPASLLAASRWRGCLGLNY
jgi:hypothetical protein